jgi:hypothetical protein
VSENKDNINKDNVDDEVDALFRLPLVDFIGARNELAARLKKGKRVDDANVVKTLAKPSVTAWAVNQLYWNLRGDFDRLLEASQNFRQAQASRTGVKTADLRASLDVRREALAHLSEEAVSLLRDAGHNPTPDTVHRITTTLEAVSANASPSDGSRLGRLTRDLDPPGFDSLVSLMVDAGAPKVHKEPKTAAPSKESASAAADTSKKASLDEEVQKARQLEDARKTKITAARVSLQDAERSLAETTARAGQLEAARKKAQEGAEHAAAELRDLEERLKKARAASLDAGERSRSIAAEARESARAVEDARRAVEKASKALELLIRESKAN